MKKVYLAVLMIFGVNLAYSNGEKKQTEKEAQVADTPEEAKAEEANKGTLSFSGYIDSYFSANFNKPLSMTNVGASGTSRVFDTRSGQLTLGLVQTMMTYTTDKSEAVVDLAFGPNADMANYGNALFNTALAIKQAYFTYNFTDKFSMTVGQFGTHIGYEVIDAPVNFNYSLSNLFNNGPFYHAGLKATYAFSDKVSLMAGIVNNVDGLGDNNRKKGVIGQLFIAPVEEWSIYLNAIHSNEADPLADGSTPSAFYQVFDLATSYQVTDNFLLGLNAAVGSQKGDMQGGGGPAEAKSWGGAALYANVKFSELFSLGGRYEYFDNSNGVRGLVSFPGGFEANPVGTHVNSYTLTGNFTLASGHILIKPEIRIDSHAKRGAGELQQFEDSKGEFTKNSQTTAGLAFIYKF